MRSKRAAEAYVLIDHRNSPGITPEFVLANNLDAPVVGAGVTYESAMAVCSHCGADVILNPNRSREREWCRTCDAYICDGCALLRKLGAAHKPLMQVISEIYEFAMKRKEPEL
jgi:hypothetical protein